MSANVAGKLALQSNAKCMNVVSLHDKKQIETFLRQDTHLHIYSIGDLDDFFWKYTSWHGLESGGELKAVILLYIGSSLPTVLALSQDIYHINKLLSSVFPFLPRRFYAHLSPGLEEVMAKYFTLKSHGKHYKMALKNKSAVYSLDTAKVGSLSVKDIDQILALYKTSYPDNWFNERMLLTGQYFGVKEENELVSIAGVHVFSPEYRVAALGNITTHPNHRGKGYGKATVAMLCKSLCSEVDHIGLNVKADNHPAISLYEKLGFEIICTYNEYIAEAKSFRNNGV